MLEEMLTNRQSWQCQHCLNGIRQWWKGCLNGQPMLTISILSSVTGNIDIVNIACLSTLPVTYTLHKALLLGLGLEGWPLKNVDITSSNYLCNRMHHQEPNIFSIRSNLTRPISYMCRTRGRQKQSTTQVLFGLWKFLLLHYYTFCFYYNYYYFYFS